MGSGKHYMAFQRGETFRAHKLNVSLDVGGTLFPFFGLVDQISRAAIFERKALDFVVSRIVESET